VNRSEIEQHLSKLDGRGSDSEFAAVEALAKLGDRFPELLLDKYRSARKWGDRASCVYHATKYAKSNEAAYKVGIEALRDRSKVVRYRACLLLAVAQRAEAIGFLEPLLFDSNTGSDAKAAIDAIKHQNQNYFVDRDHSGKVRLNINIVDMAKNTSDP
jgi:hypothetical protein